VNGPAPPPAALDARDVVAGYEPGLPIVHGASITVRAGEIVALLGPNGAGKSTLVRAVAGLVPVTSGHVHLDGREITGRPAHDMAALGLAFVPQTDNVFTRMTVDDNLELAGFRLDAADRRRQMAAVFDLFPDLARQRRLLAGRLSGGQRHMLAVARALAARPRVLMLDEPSAGLSPRLVGVLLDQIRAVRARGATILMVEQNVRAALAVADRAYVLVEGRERHQGPASELAGNPELVRLYLGAGLARR
jgi:branched-chain amino acid transport system ATP-binding protein